MGAARPTGGSGGDHFVEQYEFSLPEPADTDGFSRKLILEIVATVDTPVAVPPSTNEQ